MSNKKYKSVVFCGFVASGKTTIAKNIAKIFNLEYICAGDLLKEMINKANKKNKNIEKNDFWETKQGFAFFKERQNKDEFDRKLDKLLLDLVEQRPVSLTSWTLPYLNCNAVKIFIKVKEEDRIRRMAERDNISYEDSKKLLKKRDNQNKKIYKKLYGFELGNENVFDFILNTQNNIQDDIKLVEFFLNDISIKFRKEHYVR